MNPLVAKEALKRNGTQNVVLKAEGLHKSFKMGDTAVKVLTDVSFEAKQGEFIAIEGRSGSGKSTLLHLLGGLDAPDSGTIVSESLNIGELAQKAATEREKAARLGRTIGPAGAPIRLIFDIITMPWRLKADGVLAGVRNARFGFVFQFYHLLPELNVLENTMLHAMIRHSWFDFHGKSADLRDRACKLLQQLGMDHRLKHRPSQLSGGERQRVAIARALMNSPRVLFADEPTGNLDVETGAQIMAVLERLHREQNQTIIMVTHDRTLARTADRVLVLKQGVLQQGEGGVSSQ